MGVPVGLIVRCTALIVYLYTWNVYINTEFTGRFDIRLRYGSYYEFLTNLSFLLSIIVNVFLVIGELLPKVQHGGHLMNFAASFPSTVIVFIYFWTVFCIDRELIYPIELDKCQSFWVVFVKHGVILPVSLFNILYEPFQGRRWIVYSINIAASVGYYGWVIHIYHASGHWVYPFMTVLGEAKVMYILLPITMVVVGILTRLAMALNMKIHSTEYTISTHRIQPVSNEDKEPLSD